MARYKQSQRIIVELGEPLEKLTARVVKPDVSYRELWASSPASFASKVVATALQARKLLKGTWLWVELLESHSSDSDYYEEKLLCVEESDIRPA